MASQEYRILASGYRSTIALLSFSPSDGSVKVVSESPAPPSASWLEFDPFNQAGNGKDKVAGGDQRQGLYTISRPDRAAQGEEQVVYTISEDEEKGLGVSAVLKGDKVEITGQRGTRGAPAHLLVLQDGSGILIANYMGGNIIFLPTDDSGAIVPASSSPESIELKFDFPYSSGSAPNKERQDSSHPHQAIQASNGDIYICDLGSDRIWVISKTPSALELKGYLQAPPGAGPRHAVFSKDEKHLYVLTELTSEVLIYDLSTEDGGAAYPKHPMPEFKASIIPPNIPKSHSSKMDSAELLLHPSYPRTLFASNRLELHIAENEPHLDPLPKEATEGVKGDAVAIFTLSEDGKKVVQTKHVRTEADGIRGMQISTDGKYVALAGQQKGGVEIWQIGGENGEEWKRVAKNESIEQVTDLKWF